jgi:serine/threonine protein kinase
MWRCLRHPNIVPFFGTSKHFHVSLVSEWMTGGTVTTFLREHPHSERSFLVSHDLNAWVVLNVVIPR